MICWLLNILSNFLIDVKKIEIFQTKISMKYPIIPIIIINLDLTMWETENDFIWTFGGYTGYHNFFFLYLCNLLAPPLLYKAKWHTQSKRVNHVLDFESEVNKNKWISQVFP